MRFGTHNGWLRSTALVCAAMLAPGNLRLLAQEPAAGAEAPKLKSADQLDSLVAPLALYPDPLLAQVLAASTYPLEIVQCARWLKENPKLTGENLTKAAAKKPWDASVQALVAFPAALNLMDQNVQWTQDMGNAFLDQQSDVMDAIQRMRKKAKDAGKLTTTQEQNVEVKTIESKTVIEIQPAKPEVIYVPSYDPVVVYGAAPVYAYPPVVYPYGAVAATAAISFGVGVAMGAFWGGGGGYGWGCGWGNNNININNNFNARYGYNNINGGNRTNINGGNRTNIGNGNSSWTHNPEHRRAVPYGSGNTAQRFNGTARDSSGRTQRFDGRTGAADRSAGDRGNAANGGAGDRGGANRAQPTSRGSGGGDRVGNRSIDSGSRSTNALGGSGSRSRTEASSNRGFSSTRQSSGGGAARTGGAARSGGGGRRR